MAFCECLDNCLFFNNKMGIEAIAASFYKQKFCNGDNSECARFLVYSEFGSNDVPSDLYPNETERAINFIISRSYS